jgi:hypothetical protein
VPFRHCGKTLIFDREEMLKLADKHKITVVGSPAETKFRIVPVKSLANYLREHAFEAKTRV